jgi:hypothetical protein
MLKSSSLLLLGSISLITLSSGAIAQAPSAKVPNTKAANTQTPNVTGAWKVSLGEEGRTATYVFSQKGNELTGTMKGLPFGDMPIAGTIAKDGKLSFSGNMRGMKFSFAGTLTGQTMKGIADLPIGRKNWTATK